MCNHKIPNDLRQKIRNILRNHCELNDREIDFYLESRRLKETHIRNLITVSEYLIRRKDELACILLKPLLLTDIRTIISDNDEKIYSCEIVAVIRSGECP